LCDVGGVHRSRSGEVGVQVHGVDAQGKVVVTKRLHRDAVLTFFANLAPCVVEMEACAGSHFWAREIARLGHT
jgi:transposase